MTHTNYKVTYTVNGLQNTTFMDTAADAVKFANTMTHITHNDATVTFPDNSVERFYWSMNMVMVTWVKC